MTKMPPLILVEPTTRQKHYRLAEVILKGAVSYSEEEVKLRLKQIRDYSVDNIGELAERFRWSIANYSDAHFTLANDAIEAVDYITHVAEDTKAVYIGKSSTINELRPGLEKSGYTLIDTYSPQFCQGSEVQKRINYPWQLPTMSSFSGWDTFNYSTDSRQQTMPDQGVKDIVALLGVNAASAEDGSIFFLQHSDNIGAMVRQARKLILVIGLDKIVERSSDAFFQTKCAGAFGIESIILDLKIGDTTQGVIDPLAEIPETTDLSRELHIVLLDNGRTSIVRSDYKELLQCIGCRACNSPCPAYLSGKPLSPRELILNFKKHLPKIGPDLLKAEGGTEIPLVDPEESVITEDEIWACTTCRACQEVCPVQVEHINAIVGLRRDLVMVSMSETARDPLRNIRVRGHPWLGTTLARTDWTEGLDIKILAEDSDIDILYWVGCTEALEDRSIKIAQATAKLLKLAGVNFGILGEEESCCGEPARRLGNERLFQIQAQKNIKLLQSYDVKKIVTACPHCFNTIKNEYPQFGGEFEVIHHTQFIAELLKENRLGITKGNGGAITYHDPCYLGRYNDIYQPPRHILNSMPDTDVIEMEPNLERSFCCGGGGGRMWLEERTGKRISEMRIEQAIETKAQIVATACPFCLQMFEDAIKAKGVEESLKVMDISELVEGSVIF